MTADLVPDPSVRGTAYGILGAVNGVGDLVASLLVGLFWTDLAAPAGLLAAAGLMAAGAVDLVGLPIGSEYARRDSNPQPSVPKTDALSS